MELKKCPYFASISVPYEVNLPRLELKRGTFLARVNAAKRTEDSSTFLAKETK